MTAGPPMHRDPVRRLDDTGIRVLAVEVLRIGPGTKREYHERALESGAELGARYVIVNGDDPNIDRVSGAMRLLPGEGELPLAELLAVFPEGIPVSVEAPVPSPLETLAPVELARRARQAAANVLAATRARSTLST
jgi:hypothetical protein